MPKIKNMTTKNILYALYNLVNQEINTISWSSGSQSIINSVLGQ